MKKLLPILILILIGCSEPEPIDKKLLTVDEKGNFYYLNNLYSGPFRETLINGNDYTNFYIIGEIKNGIIHGTFKKFDSSFEEHKIISETTYDNGFNIGPQIFYDLNGNSYSFEGLFEFYRIVDSEGEDIYKPENFLGRIYYDYSQNKRLYFTFQTQEDNYWKLETNKWIRFNEFDFKYGDNFSIIEYNGKSSFDYDDNDLKSDKWISSIELIEPFKFKLKHIGGTTFEEGTDENDPDYYIKKIKDDEFVKEFLLY